MGRPGAGCAQGTFAWSRRRVELSDGLKACTRRRVSASACSESSCDRNRRPCHSVGRDNREPVVAAGQAMTRAYRRYWPLTVSGGVWFAAISAALTGICLVAAILISEGGAGYIDRSATGPVPYLFGLAALVLLLVGLVRGRTRALFRDPRSLVGLAAGVAVVIAVAVAVNSISPYPNSAPAVNLVSIARRPRAHLPPGTPFPLHT